MNRRRISFTYQMGRRSSAGGAPPAPRTIAVLAPEVTHLRFRVKREREE